MLQNPSAKLSDVDPAVAQHYHDKLLEARREKAHVRPATAPLAFLYGEELVVVQRSGVKVLRLLICIVLCASASGERYANSTWGS